MEINYCANGLLQPGNHVKTNYLIGQYGHEKWYYGICQECYKNNTCKIRYDNANNYIVCNEDVFNIVDLGKDNKYNQVYKLKNKKSRCKTIKCVIS